jgi:hypothetical protein
MQLRILINRQRKPVFAQPLPWPKRHGWYQRRKNKDTKNYIKHHIPVPLPYSVHPSRFPNEYILIMTYNYLWKVTSALISDFHSPSYEDKNRWESGFRTFPSFPPWKNRPGYVSCRIGELHITLTALPVEVTLKRTICGPNESHVPDFSVPAYSQLEVWLADDRSDRQLPTGSTRREHPNLVSTLLQNRQCCTHELISIATSQTTRVFALEDW